MNGAVEWFRSLGQSVSDFVQRRRHALGQALGAGASQRPWRLAARVTLGLLAVAGASGALYGAVVWHTCGFQSCPDPESLIAYQPAAAPVILDRDGDVLTQLMPLDRTVIALDSLPPDVLEAFVAVEDQRFFDHDGVDWRRVFGAMLANVRAGRFEEGASTITMQLARNLFPDRLPASNRTLRRKLAEARVALAIERRFSKREILELYLNNVYFGEGAYGIDAAARGFFGVSAVGLELEQAAMLAAKLRAPSYYDPHTRPDTVKQRRDLVLAMMARQGRIDAGRADSLRALPLEVVDEVETANAAPLAGYFVEHVRGLLEERFGPDMYGRGLRVWTTLDVDVQRAAERRLEQQLAQIESGVYGSWTAPTLGADASADTLGSSYLQGALVMLEAETGDVLALVGGRSFRQSTFNRALDGKRQVGSAFKPFVFAAALAEGYAPSQPILDAPFTVALDRGREWSPENYGGSFEGLVNMRDALVRSRNVPTVRLAQAVGIDPIVNTASSVGIADGLGREPSIALGTVSLSPLELAAAYTAFANLGTRVEPRFIASVQDSSGTVLWSGEVLSRPAIDPAVAFIVNDMLRQAVDEGTGYAVRSIGYWGVAAGKTGTTSDALDTWFVGYTPSVVGTVWIGFDQPRPILPRATGGALAAPVWGGLMSDVAESHGRDLGVDRAWAAPAAVEFHTVDPETGLVLDRNCSGRSGGSMAVPETFLRGSVPDATCPSPRTLGGWVSRMFDGLFRRGEGDDERPMTPNRTAWDDPRAEALGAAILPGTVDGGATSSPATQRVERRRERSRRDSDRGR